MFLQTVFDFLLVSIAIFAMVQVISTLKKTDQAAAPPPEPPKQEVLLGEILAAIKAQK
jgi:large conductance mechanosensitive channel